MNACNYGGGGVEREGRTNDRWRERDRDIESEDGYKRGVVVDVEVKGRYFDTEKRQGGGVKRNGSLELYTPVRNDRPNRMVGRPVSSSVLV